MSLATRCPACGTTFRIEPEQLALADGWARCGRCSTVFDAAAAQRPEPADDAASVAEVSASTPAASMPGGASSDMDAFGEALLSFRADVSPPPASRSRAEGDPDLTDDVAEANDASPEPSTTSGSLSPAIAPMPPAFDPWRELPSLSLDPDPVAPVSVSVPVPTSGRPASSAVAPEASIADEPATKSSESPASAGPLWSVPPSGSSDPGPGPSGVRPAVRAESVAPSGVIHAASEPVNDQGAAARKPRGAGRRRSWRMALLLLAIVLLLALMAQVLYRQRDVVAARHPALRPALAALCGFADCTIAPLRRPGDIAIEGGTFVHAQDSDRYRLDFALRNQTDVPLAMPAIELSLLDAQERAVVRRVLMPMEFGIAEATLPALAERAGTVSFALGTGAEAGSEPLPRIAGYAMVAFYP